MSDQERGSIRSEIAALEAELDERAKPTQQAREKTSGESILAELHELEEMVKTACGHAYMDEEDDDDESAMYPTMMDDDEPVVLDLDDGLDAVDEEEVVFASETKPGIEDEITQDYLDDVLEEEKPDDDIVTDETMLDTTSTGYVGSRKAFIARLKSASGRLDKVAEYLEEQGNDELAFRIDKMADQVDARIDKEMSDA